MAVTLKTRKVFQHDLQTVVQRPVCALPVTGCLLEAARAVIEEERLSVILFA